MSRLRIDAPHETKAAQTIQRVFRGHRERRQLQGLSLSPCSRWDEALKEARFRQLTSNIPRPSQDQRDLSLDDQRRRRSSFARAEWRRLAAVAAKAHNDNSSSESDEASLQGEELEQYRRRKAAAKNARDADARLMGLEYFLEMVDTKHRYGSHLRSYHAEWKKAPTNQNFFYWLDEGDGKDVEIEACSRERLEKDQVRYLNREERLKYLVQIDSQGRLRWAKNDELINTNYQFKDSLEGIVSSSSAAPAFREEVHGKRHEQQDPETDPRVHSFSSESSEDSIKEGQHYINRDMQQAQGLKKVQFVSAAALLNHLLRETTKKNTWIFVADTSFRLYVGIKQSGSFQHSSFLQGGRISAAGLIKIKNGVLRSLSPLSGHYRPPTRNFRAFVHALQDAGCDMSRVNISKSYAVLLGLEGYLSTKRTAKKGLTKIEIQAEKLFNPEEARARQEREEDRSESARKEREHLQKQREKLEHERRQTGWRRRLSLKLGLQKKAPEE